MKKINYEKDKRALRDFTAAELARCSAAGATRTENQRERLR
jgi:hypothetical protein